MKSNNETHKNDSVGKLRFEASETADRKKLKLNDNLFYIFQGQIRRRLLGLKQRQNLEIPKSVFNNHCSPLGWHRWQPIGILFYISKTGTLHVTAVAQFFE